LNYIEKSLTSERLSWGKRLCGDGLDVVDELLEGGPQVIGGGIHGHVQGLVLGHVAGLGLVPAGAASKGLQGLT